MLKQMHMKPRKYCYVACLICSFASPGFAQRESSASQLCRVEGSSGASLREIPEASGIAVSRNSPGVLWAHNDSREAVVFALDVQGAVKGRVRVTNAQIDDWEDIAVGPCPKGSCLYVGDSLS